MSSVGFFIDKVLPTRITKEKNFIRHFQVKLVFCRTILHIDEVIKNIELSKSTRESITPPGSDRIPIFYVLPKIHKELDSKLPLGYPDRPIVSGCGSFTENISAYVDSILKPHMESLSLYVKDISDFITKIHDLHVKGIPQNAFYGNLRC